MKAERLTVAKRQFQSFLTLCTVLDSELLGAQAHAVF